MNCENPIANRSINEFALLDLQGSWQMVLATYLPKLGGVSQNSQYFYSQDLYSCLRQISASNAFVCSELSAFEKSTPTTPL